MDRITEAADIMRVFAARTGITSPAPPRRYLWTDAFAVCNCLALAQHTSDAEWRHIARALIAQVHGVLGRHRADDERSGWISGLEEAAGERHPTAGGLRIGKPLPERAPGERPDPERDWDRDGQYYHYLTRWLHALARAADVLDDAEPLRHGIELAQAAHAAFAHGPPADRRLYWKMSIDLKQPVVAAMGEHDALDGLVATALLHAEARRRAGSEPLQHELRELAGMCGGRGWATRDALGIGGLLVDALLLARLHGDVDAIPAALLDRVLRDAARSLDLLTLGSFPDGAADERLAFRELGLALGLAALERLSALRSDDALATLRRHVPLRARIEGFWLDAAHRAADAWREHEDINDVMLATCLVPDGYLG